VGGVLLVEYLAISISFDAGSVRQRGGAWAFVGEIGLVAPLAVVLLTAFLLLRPRSEQNETAAGDQPAPAHLAPQPGSISRLLAGRAPLLLAHGVLLAAFTALTRHVFGRPETPSGPVLVWLSAWLVTGLGAAGTLALGVIGREKVMHGLAPRAAASTLVLSVIAWLAGIGSLQYWLPLSRWTLRVVEHILDVVLPGEALSRRDELSIEVRDFEVSIAPECSGFEGMGLISALFVGYLFAFKSSLKFPNALALLPLGLCLVWFCNALRIAALMLIGAFVDHELAYGAFHSKAGWVLFCAVALGLGTAGRRLGFLSLDVIPPERAENPTAAYLLPLLSLIAAALVTGSIAQHVDYFYAVRILAALALLWVFRRAYLELEFRCSPVSILVGLLVGVGWIATAPSGGHSGAALAQSLAELEGWLFWVWIGFRAFGSVVVVPVCEELAFRGYLMRYLISRDFTSVSYRSFTPLAVFVSSLLFGLVHERWVAAALAGACYAFLQIRTGRLFDAIAAHAVSNACVAIWIAWSGDFGLWA
jgi:exosortase E/protease (VPEID-CTERM system)